MVSGMKPEEFRDRSVVTLATLIAEQMIAQNNELEFCTREESEAIGYYDQYDNKYYDCEVVAHAVLDKFWGPAS